VLHTGLASFCRWVEKNFSMEKRVLAKIFLLTETSFFPLELFLQLKTKSGTLFSNVTVANLASRCQFEV